MMGVEGPCDGPGASPSWGTPDIRSATRLLEIGGEEAMVRFGRSVLDTPGARAVLVWNGDEARCRIATGGDRVSGALPWVPADRVDLLVLLDEQGATLVRDGIRCEPVRGAGLRAAGASALSLDAAPVVATPRGAEAATRALARAPLHTAALLIGIMRESAEFSRSYALERVAFGKPIAHHQELAFLIADMATAVDASRLLLWEAAWRLDEAAEGGPCSTELAAEACATAFAEAVEQSQFVTPNGVQILGGHGFMQDYPVEKRMREARALGLLLGGVDRAREEAGRELCAWEGPIALTVEAAS